MEKILVTGARSGIINNVIDKIKDKYEIYVTVRTDEQLKAVKEKYKRNKNIKCLKLDITKEKDRKKLENLEIDTFIANAAVAEGGSISEIPFDRVRENFEVNVFANFELLQIVLRNMLKKDKGKVIIMSSLAGVIPIDFLGVYCATKASIKMFATTLKNELKLVNTNVKIKMIEPGLYHTGFNEIAFENKYDWMMEKSYFKNVIPEIKAKENLLLALAEKDDLDTITNKIIKAIEDDTDKFKYTAPILQSIGAKLYQIID